jgi:magnesium chelatase subunit I
MNPEEGRLRPQILDRFGLRVNVRGLTASEDRIEVYNRVRDYRRAPHGFVRQWERVTAEVREDVLAARDRLKETTLSDDAVRVGMELIEQLQIDSHRAEYAMFEAARAHAAADGRTQANAADMRVVAPMALRQRRSEFMTHFFEQQQAEDDQIRSSIDRLVDDARPAAKARKRKKSVQN